ncbi:unnamed protein product, partial [Brenthis ino]
MNFIFHSVMLTLNIIICECSGIFHEKSKIVFRPDSNASEYFGYTVLLASDKLIVGAPVAPSRYRPNLTSGLVYVCSLNNLSVKNVTCHPFGMDDDIQSRLYQRLALHSDFLKNDMWLGATIAVVPNGKLMMCAPRWMTPYKDSHLLENGACYLSSKRYGTNLYPLKENVRQAHRTSGTRREYGEYGLLLNFYAYGQAGFAIKVSNESVILGAPGLLQWTGGIVVYRYFSDSEYFSLQQTMNPYYTLDVGPDDYLGYSVESGVFEAHGDTLYVAGAPRSKGGYGQVLIFEPPFRETDPLNIKAKLRGSQLGAYFGGTLCCVDLNGDGITDLLVGAPNYVKEDGGLHYDQGAVFVYLTEQTNSSFIITPAGYITGSSSNGNRFGSAIASLGDVDGDGYNDIAVGAPWEDDERGAVYIFKGGKKGLKSQYIQKIMVENSKSFGFSISTGLDVNGDECNDISIGAFTTNAAYVFTCIPSMYVETIIKVPDAMNLQQNATNFTALFCVKAVQLRTWSHVKIDFKAKITIDPKENRAKINGDSEYDVTISAGSENCDEQVVEVKPTADLSRPISMKFKLEVNNDWEDSTEVASHTGRLSDNSKLETSFDIQLIRDCGEDMICKPWLVMSLQPINSTYVPGTDDKLGVKLTVFNKEEPSFGAKVHLILPYSPIRLPSECSLEELNVTCNLPGPLRREETVEYEIELEYTYKDTVEEIIVVAILDDPMYNETDIERRVEEQIIVVSPKATFEISGQALPNATIAVTRDKLDEAANITLQHYYEVTNFGPSDWFHLRLQIILSDKVNLSSRIKGCSEDGEECKWKIPAKVSRSIVLPLKFDLGLYGEFLQEEVEYNITSTVILEGQNKSASITTTLVLEPAPLIWPYIVGGVAGILLLLLIVLTLYKCGFFSRKRLEDFQRLQEQEMSEEASTSASGNNSAEASSQELIVEDSD